jgi:AbrB family looped-hinge helix DNA binding protein
MGKAVAVTVDSKGRVTIPAAAREALGLEAGAVLFLEQEGEVLRLARAVNPFDELARDAVESHRAGRTRGLREFARECGDPAE